VAGRQVEGGRQAVGRQMVQVAERRQAGRWKTDGRQENGRQTGCGQAVEIAERRKAGRWKVGGRQAEGRRCK
jgi:hypothetical protein